MKKLKALFKARPIISSIIAVIVVGGGIYIVASRNGGSGYQFVTVTKGSITEEVTVTGNTTPVSSVDMAFQNTGTINAVNYPQGSPVSSGDMVVTLDTTALQAQLAQAQADVDTEKADLASLEAGSTAQEIQVAQTAVNTAEQSLNNYYMSVPSVVAEAYSEANDAVRNQIGDLFTGDELDNPQLAFAVSDSQIENTVNLEREQAAIDLNSWETELQQVNATSSTSTLSDALAYAANDLSFLQTFFINMMTAANDSSAVPADTVTYQDDVSAGSKEVDTAVSSVNSSIQDIASEADTVQQEIAALNVQLAGPTTQAVQAQEAEVEQAMASVQNIQAEISQASLTAPISGVISVQNGVVGQVVTPGQTIFSIISSNNLEVDADVPEVDIGKVAVGNVVDMNFDAFPNENFTGKVFYIDPAQTIVGGVVNYLVKVSIDQNDPAIKSGLTVNLNILTQTDTNALILPQFAVLQNSSGSFVEVIQNGKVVQVPVTTGLQDENGNIEITSGVTNGEQVLNIGLKQ